MTTTAIPTDQALMNAELQLTDLDEQEHTINTKLDELKITIDAHRDRQEQHQHRLSHLHRQVESAQTDYDQASTFAKITVDTPQEQASVKAAAAARKTLNHAKAQLEQAQKQHETESPDEQRQIEDLQKQVVALGDEMRAIFAERRNLATMKEQMKRDIATQKYEAHKLAFTQKHLLVEQIRQQLTEAQMDLQDLHTSALDELAPWPDLQDAMSTLQPPDDWFTRIVKADLYYINAWMEERDNIDRSFDQRVHLPSLKNAWGHTSIFDVIFVHENLIRSVMSNGTYADRELILRREKLQAMLDEYRMVKRENA
jgi:myosin heavy subunit